MKSKRKEMKDEAGKKFDYGKLRYDLVPGDALEELTKVYTYGAQKYAEQNWRKGMQWGRVFGALMRHAWAFWRGEDYDPESGLHHMAQVAWQAFTLINYCKTYPDKDDRIKDIATEKEVKK